MNKAEQSILKILAYYNLFSHPLKREEILRFLDTPYADSVLDNAFNSLLETGIIFRIQDFYLIQNDPALIARRLRGNRLAARQIRLAARIARFLSKFPYVKGIAVSGSLSKNYADSSSDIDFFIITQRNRLWIARSLMHLFKKLTFLAGCQHWFCMNYYIDEAGLEIKEKNIFTAMEIATLLPFYDDGVFNSFFDSNKWVNRFFPFFIHQVSISTVKQNGLRNWLESILNRLVSDNMDQSLMQFTLKRWHKKAMRQKKSYNGGLMGMDGSTHHAKPDPHHFQEKLLGQYREAADTLIKQFMLQTQSAEAPFLHKEIM